MEEDDEPISAILKAMNQMDADDYNVDLSKWSISSGATSGDNSWNVVFDDMMEDRSYGILPVENNPELYTSHEQRERHDKYPALKKAWDDYNALFALTKGEPPNV